MRFTTLLILPVIAAIAACTRTSVMPLTADTIAVTTSAAPLCGGAGAQSVAVHQAAVETIRAGYDRFIVLDDQASSTMGVVGFTPVTANTTYSANLTGSPGLTSINGTAATTYSGGMPIIAGHHNNTVLVKLFHESDPAGANGVSARGFLGPDWQSAIKAAGRGTCL